MQCTTCFVPCTLLTQQCNALYLCFHLYTFVCIFMYCTCTQLPTAGILSRPWTAQQCLCPPFGGLLSPFWWVTVPLLLGCYPTFGGFCPPFVGFLSPLWWVLSPFWWVAVPLFVGCSPLWWVLPPFWWVAVPSLVCCCAPFGGLLSLPWWVGDLLPPLWWLGCCSPLSHHQQTHPVHLAGRHSSKEKTSTNFNKQQ